MATTNKPLVLVLGGTGHTGRSIVDALLKSGNFSIAVLVRPTSVTKPAAEELKASGVEIRVGSLTDDYEKLKQVLQGVQILISTVDGRVVRDQREIFRAAKEVGVQRVIPCDWATPGARGVRFLTDIKLDIHDYIKELGLGYTIIDVGWWSQLFLPLPLRSTVAQHLKEMSWTVYGSGEAKNLLTNVHHIGTWVARIIADPRTLNKYVIIWEDERTQKDAFEIGARASGDGDALIAKRIQVSEEDLKKEIAEGAAEYAKDPTNFGAALKFMGGQYMTSMHFLQENTLENAKRLGYLDARELYPDIPAQSLEEFAEEFYSLPEPGITRVRE
ncbi:NAD-P-binding protein [Polyporus arcularius HHB13444]|uniref:NAD-P-binding protein n=1 Tax=Polyporus arcularius HHB13444 TaxID=1314778 RepID=A0A5C3P885_9APHY|nr:NAD-P-binding protein [Polyporus arcularius HHB13444]